jgi:outer membrane protein TolC
MKPNSWCTAGTRAVLCGAMILLPLCGWAEPVALRHMVELALKHATTGDIAAADEQRAFANYRELRNNFIPQMTAGAGLGWTYGFPLSLEGAAPSLFNVTAQSPLLHFEMRDFLAAARADSTVATLRRTDQRNQVIQDTVLSYAELRKWEQRLLRLKDTETDAQKMQAAVAKRVKEGIDSELEGTKAHLSTARVHLRVAEAQGAADVLRERLSKLTGMPAAEIETEDSVPPARESAPEEARAAVDANPNVKAAVENARAQFLRAQGEHKSWLPSMDFAAQYAILSTFNNYEDYFQQGSFKRNNATIGAVLRLPILNAPQRARAQEADADALKARKQAEAARNQVSEETLRLQRTVTQMQAAHDVAQLEYEVAEKNLAAVQTRSDSGTATLHDIDDARSQASERFIAMQDVAFELERAQIGLMRATGDLENWALGGH